MTLLGNQLLTSFRRQPVANARARIKRRLRKYEVEFDPGESLEFLQLKVELAELFTQAPEAERMPRCITLKFYAEV